MSTHQSKPGQRARAAEFRTDGTWQAIERHFYGFGEADALFNA